MKDRFRLVPYGKRDGTYFLHDNTTGKRKSLHTKDKKRANELLVASNEAAREPAFNLQKARIYLSAADPEIGKRTWTDALYGWIGSKAEGSETRKRIETFAKDEALELILDKPLLETKAEDLLMVLANGTVSTNSFLRKLHNHCIGMNWLPWPILAKKLWPKIKHKKKRAITAAEHQKIVGAEKNPERKNLYELCWHLGGSQSDIAKLNAEDIDWNDWTVCYDRQKLASADRDNIKPPIIKFGKTCAEILRSLPGQGPLFPYLRDVRACDRATEFKQRCRGLGIKGVTLHCYRYAWAQRARKAGYPRRYAEEALGHNCKAVHDAYADGGEVTVPSLEDYEELKSKGLVQVEFKQQGSMIHAVSLPIRDRNAAPG